MGTHPIFESDFDCLTEQIMQRRIVTTSTRGIKSMWGHNTPSNTKVLTNNQKTLTQASLTRAKDDFVKGTKKSATLAYPEDALITHHAAAKAVSGVGDETEGRLVTISQTTRNVMQSTDKNAQYWQIEFDTQERWDGAQQRIPCRIPTDGCISKQRKQLLILPIVRAGRSIKSSSQERRSSSSENMATTLRGTSDSESPPSKNLLRCST